MLAYEDEITQSARAAIDIHRRALRVDARHGYEAAIVETERRGGSDAAELSRAPPYGVAAAAVCRFTPAYGDDAHADTR